MTHSRYFDPIFDAMNALPIKPSVRTYLTAVIVGVVAKEMDVDPSTVLRKYGQEIELQIESLRREATTLLPQPAPIVG
jgi:hypothetical protein